MSANCYLHYLLLLRAECFSEWNRAFLRVMLMVQKKKTTVFELYGMLDFFVIVF